MLLITSPLSLEHSRIILNLCQKHIVVPSGLRVFTYTIHMQMCTNQNVNAGVFRTSSNYLSKVMLVHYTQMCGYISKSTDIWSNMLMNTFHSVGV